MTQWKILAELSKSGIVTLVLISVLGGYLIGHPFELNFDWKRLLTTLIGVLCLASASSALNQIQERHIDITMPRTAKRPLPSGRLTVAQAWSFVLAGLAIGLALLARVSWDVFGLGCAAVISYNGLYTLWWKRRWAFAAVPGAIPGALPILMGYAAAAGTPWTPAGIYVFSILFFWQMPHFWALALRFTDDYAQGGFPTLPVAHGKGVTLNHIVLWCLAYVGIALMGPLFLHVGIVYLAITIPTCIKILVELRRFTREPESKRWLHFFLWVTFSLVFFIGAAVADLWGIWALVPILAR